MIQRQDEAQDFQTPPQCLDLVRQVFGGPIGLDPCTVNSNPSGAGKFPSAFVYWGPNVSRFREVFRPYGWLA